MIYLALRSCEALSILRDTMKGEGQSNLIFMF
jgi:hypothetical protein